MDNIREHIYLAAMLHDIGKFYQRADTGSVHTSRFLSDVGKQEHIFCPQWNGRYTHKHVLWTAQFIEDFRPVFKQLVGNSNENLTDKNNLMNLAAGHHLSKDQLSPLGRIIKEADSLSSGMDRDSETAFKDEVDESSWDAFKKKRMISILETIGIDNKHMADKEWLRMPVKKMTLSTEYFPQKQFTTDPDYTRLWEEFKGEFKFIQSNTYHAFSETLLNLLAKYASCIPSSTIHFPDISLYDHLKTTAALAVCLYDVQQSGERPQDRFLLIGADFSGIQPYIYQIVSKNAGKNLKGRSFYIRMLSDAIVRYLLKTLNLYQANIIYNSGGGFYLLAPNTSTIRNRLDTAIKDIERKVFVAHGTSLYVAIDSIPLSDDALMHRNGKNIGVVWGELFVKRDRRKNQRYTTMMTEHYQQFFTPQAGKNEFDCISGEEIPSDEISCKEGELSPLRPISKAQIVLGRKLRDFNVIVIADTALPYWKEKEPLEPAHLGFHYYLLKQEELSKMKEELRASADNVTVLRPNGKEGNCDFMDTVNGINNIYGLCFYGGNELGQPKVPTFEDLCEKDLGEGVFKRLGILRMDVDNLGRIFQSGIAPERATLSRYAALSRSFDYFFSGYLNKIWREVAPDKSLIIYSGGDDVFIVGSWERIIEIAKRIRKDFQEFTCFNPTFSISGGIALLSPKYPIMKGAEESAKEEERAKTHRSADHEKNSLSILGTALDWTYEFPAVENLKDEIVNLHIEDSIKSSFISKILRHSINANIQVHKITNFKTYWMIAYDMGRMKNRTKSPKAIELITRCIKEVCGNISELNGKPIHTAFHSLELWALACRWAELELRTYNLK